MAYESYIGRNEKNGNYIIRNPSKWEHIKEGSCYNHNYYRNTETGEVLLEECDDVSYCDYYLIKDGRKEYIGVCYWDDVKFGESEKDVELWEC